MENSIFILDNISDGQYLSGISRYLAKEKIRYHSVAFARKETYQICVRFS